MTNFIFSNGKDSFLQVSFFGFEKNRQNGCYLCLYSSSYQLEIISLSIHCYDDDDDDNFTMKFYLLTYHIIDGIDFEIKFLEKNKHYQNHYLNWIQKSILLLNFNYNSS
ncbi:hypothetical protein DERP_005788, partial [Dermatophagoides pteronyssinus]